MHEILHALTQKEWESISLEGQKLLQYPGLPSLLFTNVHLHIDQVMVSLDS